MNKMFERLSPWEYQKQGKPRGVIMTNTQLQVGRSTGRSSRRRWGVAAGSLLVMVGVAGGVTPAQAADSAVSVTDGIVAETGVSTGYMVIGRGAAKREPVTITWGDGTAEIARTSCSVQRAKSRPGKCRIRAGHVYSNPGTYEVQALTAEGALLDSGTVAVVGEPTSDTPDLAKPTLVESSLWRSTMLTRINEVRAENGVAPLGSCPRLDQVAQDYAQLMADTGHFAHDGPNGESPWDRMRAGGYNMRSGAENLAWGPSNAERAQQGLEDSAGHFRNMIKPTVTNVGFGAAEDPNGRWYWVQKYGAAGNCDLDGRTVDTPAPMWVD